MGVRDRARRGGARHDRRSHAPSVGSTRPRVLGERRLTPGSWPRSSVRGRDRRRRGRATGAGRRSVADIDRGLEVTVASSIFPAVQNLLLAAGAIGLGSALTTITTSFRAELATRCSALPSARGAGSRIVPIGWPTKPLGPPRREPAVRRSHPIASNTARRGSGRTSSLETERFVAATVGSRRRPRRVRSNLRRSGGDAVHRRRFHAFTSGVRRTPEGVRARMARQRGFGLFKLQLTSRPRS